MKKWLIALVIACLVIAGFCFLFRYNKSDTAGGQAETAQAKSSDGVNADQEPAGADAVSGETESGTNSQNSGGNAVISNPTTKDKLYLAGVSAAQKALDKTIGKDNYTIGYDGEKVVISSWAEGSVIEKALSGSVSDETLKMWGDLKQSVSYVSETAINSLELLGISTPHIEYNVVDEIDKSKVLLKIMDGEIIYDILEQKPSAGQ